MLLTACASGGGRLAAGPSTSFYLSHAAGDYRPPGPPSDPWGPYILAAAGRFDVPQAWIRQVMRVESGGNEYIDGQLTVSAAGAMGLMQLEPETYQEMAARYGLGEDPFNPYDNILAGTAYIHEMYEVYGSPGFLAAYNAGPGRLDSFMNYHTPLPEETIAYVAMIAPNISGYYPEHRSDADQLALNTEPATEAGGILPPGFSPEVPDPEQLNPTPQAPDNPIAPVEVAATVPSAAPEAQESSVYVPDLGSTMQPPMPQPMSAVQSAVYSPAPAAAPPPQPPPSQYHPSFSVVSAALADTPPIRPGLEQLSSGHSGWAIQVGAYESSSNARAALGIAELSAVEMLVDGRPVVVSVHSGGHVRYRARFVGLPREDAVDACGRLSTGPTGCVVLSPEAQS